MYLRIIIRQCINNAKFVFFVTAWFPEFTADSNKDKICSINAWNKECFGLSNKCLALFFSLP